MKLLITGASGFVGQRLIEYYQQKKADITAVSRTPNNKSLKNVNAISWEDLDKQIIQQQDLIINLAGTNLAEKRWSDKRKQSIKDSRIQATKTVSQLCAQLGKNAPALFNASAIGIYPSYFQQPAPEPYHDSSTTCLNASNFLMKTACAWEEATTPAIQNDSRVVHLRFGIIIGPEGGMLKQLLLPFKFGLGAKVGNGQQTISWISIIDVIRAIDFLWQQSEIQGPVNITSPNRVSQKKFADTLAKSLKRPRLFTIPKKLVQIAFGEMGNELLLKGQNIPPYKLEELGFEWQHPTLDKCFKEIL